VFSVYPGEKSWIYFGIATTTSLCRIYSFQISSFPEKLYKNEELKKRPLTSIQIPYHVKFLVGMLQKWQLLYDVLK
jgi:hypothetical protein